MPFVYAMKFREEERFKIGHTGGDPEIRKKNLSTGSPRGLIVTHRIETDHEVLCETYLKRTLRSHLCVEGDGTEIYALTGEEIDGAFRDVQEFLEEYVPKEQDAVRLATQQSDGTLLTPGEHERELHGRLVHIREEESRLRFERELIESDLKLAIGTADGLDGIATWRAHPFPKFDRRGFRASHPDLYESFVRMGLRRQFRLWKS